ncbi:MAG TPA: protein kinase [Planctomycetota bacterium]|nr:protein kinase [Planctomycetota bacterium]
MADDSLAFGELALSRGFLTAEKLERARLARSRSPVERSLAEICVELRLLDAPTANALQRLAAVVRQKPPAEDENGLAGTVLGGCLVIERVGAGSVGTVYRGHHLRLDREVAIKVLHPRLVRIAGNLERFEREARAAAQLDHPAIVTVHDFLLERGFYFIVMQFAPGQNLRQVLYQRGPLGARRTIWIATKVLDGLAAAHDRKIVHRDIKPANIMLSRPGPGQEPRVKITDFGLVRLIIPTTGERLSAFGEILGTPQYMSPEQACGGDVDPRSDLYSVGIMMFELLTGRPPFTAKSTIEVLEQQIMNPLPSLRKIEPKTPRALEEVIEKLTCKSPDERFPDARAAIAALEAIPVEETAGYSRRAVEETRDPSKTAPGPPLLDESAIKDLQARLEKSSELSLVAFEGMEEPEPPPPAPAPEDEPVRAIRDAIARGTADAVVPEKLSLLWNEGRDDLILSLERELLAACPTLPAADFYIGLAWKKRGEWEKARARLALAIALAPDHLPARFHLSKVLTELWLVDEAQTVLEQGTLLVPESAPAALRYADFLSLVRRDAAASVKAYERAVELAPRRHEVRRRLAEVLFELNRLEEAEAVAREILEWKDDRATRELLEKIEAEYRSQLQDSSTERFAPEQSDAKLQAAKDLIVLAKRGGNHQRVVDLATRALEGRKSAGLYVALGDAHLALGDASSASKDFESALALEPESVEAKEGLARARKTM